MNEQNLPRMFDCHGGSQVLGCLPRTLTKPNGLWFPFLPKGDLIPKNDWLPWDELNGPILEYHAEKTPWIFQGPIGSCTTAASGHAIQLLNSLEGEEVERLAEASLYAWDGASFDGEEWKLVTRRADNGMALDVACLLLRVIGMAPADETGKNGVPARDWQGLNWPSRWRTLSDNHKVTEWRDNPGMDWLMHELSSGRPAVHGYGGHARLIIRGEWEVGDIYPYRFKCKNSWESEPWHYLSWAQVASGIQTYGCFSPVVTVAG